VHIPLQHYLTKKVDSMIKNVLIPSNFTVESLHVVKSILSSSQDNSKYNFILVYGASLSDSSIDLLFYSKSRMLREYSSKDFDDALNVLKNKYASKINSIRKDIFSGIHQNAFNNFLQANNIAEIHIPETFKSSSSGSINLFKFIENSSLPVQVVDIPMTAGVPEKGMVAEIFAS
jgi:hypothetical protein